MFASSRPNSKHWKMYFCIHHLTSCWQNQSLINLIEERPNKRRLISWKLSWWKKPVLKPADSNKEYLLFCDGSCNTILAILMQYDKQMQQNYVISYTSCKLTIAEQWYPIIEIELMAIIFGLQKFHCYIYCRKIKVYTDHKCLVW